MTAGLFSLRQSAVIAAGAGTGKTHSLVTLCLHLLGGAGRAEPLPASKLCAITFTEKAAAELQARLRARVERLAEGASTHEHEPELWATCAEAGQAIPSAEQWRLVRRDLGSAQVGTIHSLCTQIIRRNAAAAQVAPGFAQLDEVEALAIRREACEAAALAALQEGSPSREVAERLCAELGFRGGGFQRGLTEELMKVLEATGESGVLPAMAGDAQAALAAEARARDALLRSVAALAEAARAAQRKRPTEAAGRALAEVGAFGAQALAACPPGEVPSIWPLLDTFDSRRGSKTELGEAMTAAKDALVALADADAEVRALQLVGGLLGLSGDAQRHYRERKRRAGALDFDDLTRLAQQVLASDLRARRLEKQRIGALLVDEFQDTSRAQLALLGWLAEPPDAEGAAPAGSGLPGALPVAPGRLVAVGDRKQSIYEFRGADVASAQAFAARALADGARQHVLRRSRRSRPALVRFCNALFARALAASGEPFHTPFVIGSDDLEAHRPELGSAPCAELIDLSSVTGPDAAQREANAVARRIAQLLSEAAPERVLEVEASAGGEQPRRVRGGDVAILLRAFTHLDAYRRALLGRRIPHVVWRGRGFFATREVSDLLALLALAADPDDARALATVLRSPLGPVSDEGLLLLSRGPRSHGTGRGLVLAALSDQAALGSLAADDAEAARKLAGLIDRLHAAAALLGPASLLEEALAQTCYLAAVAAGLHGEQAAANVDKLLAMLRAAELRGDSLADTLARAQALVEQEAREAEASVVEERDPHAVRILTVHAAKGLEFPVVVVPECGALPLITNEGALQLDADLGAALRVQGADGTPRRGPRGDAVNQRRKQRELAQSRRLLYVAATRARDLVIFSAREARGGDAWRTWLDSLLAAPEGTQLLRRVREEDLAVAPALQQPALIERDAALAAALADPSAASLAVESEEVARAVALCCGPRPAARDTVIAPVTQLADAMLCPRRYQLLHEVGLPERPRAHREPASDGDSDPAELGTLAHRLLEAAPLDGTADLAALARAQGHDPGDAECREVLRAVETFLRSPLGARLRAAKEGQLLRELPFSLHLAQGETELLVRGQIDALLFEPKGALLLDYKHAAAKASEQHDLQLDTYALAARDLVSAALPVSTALVFLRSPAQPPVERPELSDAGRLALRQRLLSAGAGIARGRASGHFPLIAADRCRSLGCGFLQRCHGRAEPAVEQRKPAAQLRLF